MSKPLPTPELLHQVFEYEVTGHLRWKPRTSGSRGDAIFNASHAGQIAGAPHQGGYLQVGFKLNGVAFKLLVHRVVFAMHHGYWPESVDHDDNDRTNNRIENLRNADATGNNQNRKAIKSTSGFKGVCFRAKQGRYHAQITVLKKIHHLGAFDCPREAARAYDRAAIHHFGEYARTNQSMGVL